MTSNDHADHGRGGGFPAYPSQLLVNPYIAGAPVSGEQMFYGRDDVFAFIQRKLIGQHRDTPIVLKGERRTGKTSVLYQVGRHLDPAYRCVSIDMHGLNLNGIGGLLYGIAGSVSHGLRSDYGLDIAPPSRRAFESDPRAAFESAFLPPVLTALGQGHLVLMLDEVARLDEEIRAGHLDREVFSYLRHLIQHHPRLNFIFSLGSGLEEMQKDYAFLFSAAMYHRISFLEEAAARKLITDPVRKNFQVSPDAVDTILRITSGHPYYTQLVCHSLFDRWATGPRKPVMTAEDVLAVVDEATELGSSNLTYVWQDSSDSEKAVMACMADAMRAGARAVTSKAIRGAWHRVNGHLPERELSAALRRLASREVVTGTEDYAFTVDLQRHWIDKHRRPDGLKDELANSIRQWNREARRVRKIALISLAATVAGVAVPVAVTLINIPAGDANMSAAKACLVGEWELNGMTSTALSENHQVSYTFTGSSLLLFNSDGTGSVSYRNLRVTTNYTGGDYPWAPIDGTFNGQVKFRYSISRDPAGLVRVTYTKQVGDIETSTTYEDGTDQNTPMHKQSNFLTNSNLTCGGQENSITLRGPDQTLLDKYQPSNYLPN